MKGQLTEGWRSDKHSRCIYLGSSFKHFGKKAGACRLACSVRLHRTPSDKIIFSLGFRVLGSIFSPYNGESNGKENGK